MKLFKWMILALPVLTLLGCHSVRGPFLYGRNSVELAKVTEEGGRVSIYELKMTPVKGDMTLVVRTERVAQRPDPGITLREIDKPMAKKKSLVPYKGLYVQRVKEGGAASRAGILPGDILARMNGIDLMYMDQYDHLLKNSIDPENEVALTLFRGFRGKEQVELKLIPDTKELIIPSTKAIPLERSPGGGRAYAGFVIGTMPAEWTEKIYGDKRSTILIGGVAVGSPAYHAGLHNGDRILSVDGQYFRTAGELKEWIQEHGPRGDKARFEVYQKSGGTFRAEVALSDFDTSTYIDIPLLFDYHRRPRVTDWDFGPFGLLANYKGSYHISKSRDVNFKRRFSCLLGLFKRTWMAEESSIRLFWFIDIDSK